MKYFIIDKDNNILLEKNGDTYSVPEQIGAIPSGHLVFDMTDKVEEEAMAFGYESVDAASFGSGLELVTLRSSFGLLSADDYLNACRASVWVYWERTTQYCPVCGTRLTRHMDMGKQCPNCGAEHFPHLAPAAIVRITRKSDPSLAYDDEILLVHARNFRRAHMFGLVAGFLEGGETLEDCARREVREEVGIDIRNDGGHILRVVVHLQDVVEILLFAEVVVGEIGVVVDVPQAVHVVEPNLNGQTSP